MSAPAPRADHVPGAGASRLRRLLLLEPGEGRGLALAAAYFFFLLASYYVIRPIREQMGLAGGVRNLPWLMTATLGAMLAANPLYSWLVSRLPRRRFVPITYRFFALNLLAFYLVLQAPLGQEATVWTGRVFYIWTSVFNLFVVSVFWSVMADVHSPEQAKRLFAAIAVGGTLGAIVGAAATNQLARLAPPVHLLLLSMALLETAVQCFKGIVRRGGLDRPGRVDPGPSVWAGFTLLAKSPYLLSYCAYVLLFATTQTLLYLAQAAIVEAQLHDPTAQTRFFALVDLCVNSLTLLLQLLVTGRLVLLIGVPATLVLLPVLTLAGFAVLLRQPTLALVAAFTVLRRASHYAVDRPAREMLFTVLGADERYKTKNLIDTFVYRGGDVVGAWAPTLAAKISTAPAAPMVLAVALSALWIGNAVMLGVQHRARSRRVAE